MSNAKKALGKLLRDARKRRGMKQPEVAKHIGLEAAVSICRWEGAHAPIPPEYFLALLDVLELDRDTLFEAIEAAYPKAMKKFRTRQRQYGITPTIISDRASRPTISKTHVQRLHGLVKLYPVATLQHVVDAAIEYYLDHAEQGLDANLRPLHPLPVHTRHA
jgi:transcriptional regulator with XRE-family HTH domain